MLLGDVNSTHLKKWIQALAVDFHLALFSFNGPEEPAQLELAALDVTLYCPKNYAKTKKISYFLHYTRLKSAIESFKPDITHAHYASSYGFFGALLRKQPFVVSVWGSDVFEFPRKSYFHKQLLQFVFRRATHLMSTSNIMALEMKKYTNKEISITPFGVCASTFTPKDRHHDGEKFIVGTVKSLEYVYGIDTLIRAFKAFHAQYPNSACHIYGRGSKETEYIHLIQSLGLTDTVFLKGYIPNDVVPSVLSTFDAFCALSRSESFGVAVLEASSCAIPVIVNNIGGLTEVVDANQTGFIVNAKNEDEIVEKLLFLANESEKAKRMGLNGRSWVLAHFSWEKSVAIMRKHYETVLKSN